MLKKIKKVIKKLKKKKGFTLIELLAVIVILSILILLAMPSVLRIMENARKNSFETEVRSYFKAAQTAFAETAISQPGIKEINFKSNSSHNSCNENGAVNNSKCERKLDIDGGNMTDYNFTIISDGNSTKVKVYNISSEAYYYNTKQYNYGEPQEKSLDSNILATPNE